MTEAYTGFHQDDIHSDFARVRVPMFVGTPVISSLRPEIVALRAFGAPKPTVRRLQLAVHVTANGKPLFSAQGRFRLVVPKDKPGARSIRMLTRLDVVQLRK